LAGQTVPDFEWTAMLPGATSPSKLKLSGLYDPDGSRGLNAILAVEQAEWCGPCRQEAQEFESKVGKTWGKDGVFVLDLLIEDIQKKNDDVSLLKAVNNWRADFKLTDIAVVLDPTFYFAVSTTMGIPVNVIIDPRTMQVVKRYEGSTPAVDTSISSLVAKNKL
jgi:thiol-disulfide isomerase/thioredoxin